jgi:hypothetical protein
VLTPLDDYPIHQTALPIAHPASGDPNHYDRFWFNGYTEDFYFAAGMAVYPNRGIIDAAFAVVHDGVQRSVFASGRIPEDRSQTRIGPLTIEVVEPLRVTRVRADAADLGIDADVTFTARTVALEEPRQTMMAGSRLVMDSTRLTQWGTWTGRIAAGGAELPIDRVYGTKDRSWGVRPVGEPTPAAPELTLPQIFFLWAPINWDDCCTHFLCFERANGDRFVGSQAILQIVDDATPTWGTDATARGIEHLAGTVANVHWAPGLRRSRGASLRLLRHASVSGQLEEVIELEPLLTFRMRGLGYTHPEWGHGRWHGEQAVGSEEHKVEELDNLEPWNIHVQQVMRAKWGDRVGLGVLEQLAFGEHAPSGLTGLLDGFAP